jgi:DNA-binding response OmpR family regulator
MRLLLIEDDARLAGAVRSWLGHSGIEVDWIAAGLAAEAALQRRAYDWIVLDLGLPDIDGEALLRQLRGGGCELPVIVVTAREQVHDRIRLPDLGADDFLVKPVHLDELAARLRAVQRRRGAAAGPASALRLGGLCLVPASGTVSVDGQFVPLTKREFWLLEALLRCAVAHRHRSEPGGHRRGGQGGDREVREIPHLECASRRLDRRACARRDLQHRGGHRGAGGIEGSGLRTRGRRGPEIHRRQPVERDAQHQAGQQPVRRHRLRWRKAP